MEEGLCSLGCQFSLIRPPVMIGLCICGPCMNDGCVGVRGGLLLVRHCPAGPMRQSRMYRRTHWVVHHRCWGVSGVAVLRHVRLYHTDKTH
eukprot:scaffold54850_cov60-Attheya_sp.AAC.1